MGKDFYKGKDGGALRKAQRLIRTESSFILNQATSNMYEELEVEEYEFLGTLDSKTCDYCGGLDGKHYEVGKEKIGINYPPMHSWCRCTTVPYFADDEDDLGERIARGADGKNYYVPADMTYNDWKRLNEKGFEKNIELPGNLKSSNSLSDDIKEAIDNGIKTIEKTYDVRIDEFVYRAISDSGKIPFQFQPINDGGYFKSRLVVNELFDWEESLAKMNERIYNKNYIKGTLASKNIEGLVAHEAAHIMSFQDCKTWSSFLEREREMRKYYVEGISVYAEVSQDGSECLAEAFVRARNNEVVPERAERLINKYIERWKK